jgi:hypothetical protein
MQNWQATPPHQGVVPHQNKDETKESLWQKIKKHKDIFNVFFIFVFWRGAIEILGVFGKHIFAGIAKPEPWGPEIMRLTNIWTRWDSGWYLRIIQHGYEWVDPSKGPSNVAFFPLYPFLVKIFSFPFESNPLFIGTILSSVFLLAGLIYFYKLVEIDYKRETAYRALLFLLIFPMSFFFVTFYTESLFFFVCVASLYHGRRGQFLAASIFGFFAAFTRLVGVGLFVVLIIEYLQQREWRISKIRANIMYPWLVTLGLFAYMYMLKVRFGNALLFFQTQAAWHRSLQNPWPMLHEYYWPLVMNVATYSNRLELAHAFDFFFFVLGAVLIILCFIFVRTSYALFALFAFVPPILTGSLESMGRYLLVIFPVFILLARFGKWKPFEVLYITLMTPILAYGIWLFVNWNWVA